MLDTSIADRVRYLVRVEGMRIGDAVGMARREQADAGDPKPYRDDDPDEDTR